MTGCAKATPDADPRWHIEVLVAAAPPLSEEQQAIIRGALTNYGAHETTDERRPGRAQSTPRAARRSA